MITKFIKKNITYTGSELSSLFAYKNFDIQGDSLVAFCGPCDVALTELVDQADVKTGGVIYSSSMVHFIGEFFELDLRTGIFRQRLYISIIKETLEKMAKNVEIERRGDDLFIKNKKLSVSIATFSPVSTMLHIGINIDPTGAPVPAIGLNDLKIDPVQFVQQVLKNIAAEEESIYLARCKVRGVN